MAIFGALFVSFVTDRLKQVDLYNASQQALDFNFGGIYTLLLLTSSWFVVIAVHAAKADRLRQVPIMLALGAVCGAAFASMKVVEYAAKIRAGITMKTNDFFMYYFTMTGIHLLHVIAGTVLLLIMYRKARAGGYHGANFAGLEMGASYWHMVDLLWIVLFPLLYLMR